MLTKNKGFTLIELMIVMQIISIIAAIAIPNMIRFRIQTNQAAAVGNLAAVSRAQAMFTGAERGYATSFADLRDTPISKGQVAYLDIDFTAGTVSGYDYALEPAGEPVPTNSGVEGNSDFHARANPANPGSFGSGIYYYYVDATGVIRYSKEGPADETSNVL